MDQSTFLSLARSYVQTNEVWILDMASFSYVQTNEACILDMASFSWKKAEAQSSTLGSEGSADEVGKRLKLTAPP
eukprot:gene23106-30305_t